MRKILLLMVGFAISLTACQKNEGTRIRRDNDVFVYDNDSAEWNIDPCCDRCLRYRNFGQSLYFGNLPQ